MVFTDLFQREPQKPKPIITSRPIFQSASSFLRDDDDYDDEYDLKKPIPQPLPLFHHRKTPTEDDELPPRPRPNPQSRLHLTLHILSTIFSVVSLALFITAIPIWDANFQHTSSIVAGDYTDGLAIAPLLLSLFSSAYLLLTEHTSLSQYLRPRFSSSNASTTATRTLRPTRLVLLAFTLLLTLAPTLTLSAINSLAQFWQAPARNSTGVIVCNLSNIFARQCQPILYQIGGLQVGGIVTGGLVWCVWVVILAVAMRAWAREKAEKKRAAVERRRRRHERRRGHKHREGHESRRHRRREAHHGHHRREREENRQDSHHGQFEKISNHHKQKGPSHSYGDNMRSAPPYESPAARQASRNVRPKETIQSWLNNRHV